MLNPFTSGSNQDKCQEVKEQYATINLSALINEYLISSIVNTDSSTQEKYLLHITKQDTFCLDYSSSNADSSDEHFTPYHTATKIFACRLAESNATLQ